MADKASLRVNKRIQLRNDRGRRWWQRTRRLLDQTISFVLPPACVSCRRAGSVFCQECQDALTWLREPLCCRCGRPTDQPTTLCRDCRNEPSPLSHIAAAVAFTGPAREAIHKFKYEGMFGVAPVLAKVMAAGWPAWASGVDLLCPVALHPERERERGYNQAVLLVQSLQKQVEIESDFSALRRIRHTRPQIGLDRSERQNNVQGAFRAERKRVAGRRILLVDDVCTTGATLTAAANALLESGAAQVSGYCLARPLFG